MAMGVFTCHGVEWFDGDTCLTCESASEYRIISALREKLNDPEAPMLGTQGGWLNYLIALIKGENK
jgi:hypothetical protein